MSSPRTTVFFAVVAIAGIAAGVYEYREAQNARSELAEAKAQGSQLQQQIVEQKAAAEKLRLQLKKIASDQPKALPAAGEHRSPLGSFLRMLSDPRVQRMTSLQAKMRLDGQYGPLFKSLNLTPQQIDQFKTLLVEKEMVAFDSMSAAQDQGIDVKSDPKGFFMAVAAGQKSVDSQISDLLGADNYSQFQQYEQTIPARNTANLLQQSLSYTSTPLTQEQSAGLVQVLTQYATPPLPANNPFAVLNNDLGVIKLGDQAIAQVQGLLSETQVQALQADVQQQRQLFNARRQSGP